MEINTARFQNYSADKVNDTWGWVEGKCQDHEIGFGHFKFVVTLRISRWKCSVGSNVAPLVICIVVKAEVAAAAAAVVNIITDLLSTGVKPVLIYL